MEALVIPTPRHWGEVAFKVLKPHLYTSWPELQEVLKRKEKGQDTELQRLISVAEEDEEALNMNRNAGMSGLQFNTTTRNTN